MMTNAERVKLIAAAFACDEATAAKQAANLSAMPDNVFTEHVASVSKTWAARNEGRIRLFAAAFECDRATAEKQVAVLAAMSDKVFRDYVGGVERTRAKRTAVERETARNKLQSEIGDYMAGCLGLPEYFAAAEQEEERRRK